ncbi:hypothetical protein TDB9533_00200 [Thalassocella blandensis]|nr:hypothetical protein TDB9533_00200 [Thalassocella blandensis]
MQELPHCALPFPESEDDIAVKCDSALQLVMEAQRAGVIDAPAISLSDFNSETGMNIQVKQLNPVRFHVVAHQLWLLGYMKYKPRRNISPSRQENENFQENLLRFQRDAGLEKDGWLGEKTWKALQELVSFETPIDPTKWIRPGGRYYTAFNRAFQLRLWAYGFVEKKPAYVFAGLKKNVLDKIEMLVRAMCSLPEDSMYSWQTVLMDAEKMRSCARRVMENPNLVGDDDTDNIRRFLISVARVELWLLGLEVDIDNTDNFPVDGYGVKQIRVRRGRKWVITGAFNKNLHRALLQFWRDLLDKSEEEAEQLAGTLSLDFFRSLQEPQNFTENTAEFNEPDFSRQAAEMFNSTAKIKEGFTQFKKLGMKLWDGIKRIWHWLVKGVKKIVKIADNLVRGFFRIATKSYVVVRTAFIALTSSVEQYARGQIDNTNPHLVLIGKDCDFLTVAESEQKVQNAAASIQNFSHRFLFSSRIIGLFVDVLSTVAQGIIGWARFLYVLVKHYRLLAPAYHALKAIPVPA